MRIYGAAIDRLKPADLYASRLMHSLYPQGSGAQGVTRNIIAWPIVLFQESEDSDASQLSCSKYAFVRQLRQVICFLLWGGGDFVAQL